MNSKVKYELEIPIHASPSMIFQYVSEPSEMNEWFVDKVTTKKDLFTFTWGEETKFARLIVNKNYEKVKYLWLNEDLSETEYFFEINIVEDDITNDVTLLISDFALPSEVEEEKLLWISFINDLKHLIGAV